MQQRTKIFYYFVYCFCYYHLLPLKRYFQVLEHLNPDWQLTHDVEEENFEALSIPRSDVLCLFLVKPYMKICIDESNAEVSFICELFDMVYFNCILRTLPLNL